MVIEALAAITYWVKEFFDYSVSRVSASNSCIGRFFGRKSESHPEEWSRSYS